MSEQTPLAKVRGHGSAKSGVKHYLAQRVTAIALVPLTVWFVYVVATYGGADYETTQSFIQQPLVSILMALFIFAAFYHFKLGIQVVIEDYIHKNTTRICLLLAANFLAYGLGVACVFSILKIAMVS